MRRSSRRWPLGAMLIAAAVGLALPASASKKKKSQPADSSTPDAGASAQLDEPPEVPVGPPLVVLPLALTPGREGEAAQAGYVAEEAVRRAKHQAVISLDEALDPAAAKARRKGTAEGLRQLKAAHNAYDQLDMQVSSDLANRAIAGLTKGDLSRNFPQVVDAFELRVAAFASDPKTLDQARAELGNLLPIDPRGELSPNLFNPDVIALAEGMRQKVKAASTLSLNVTTTPPSARVFVDGVFRGVSPLEVTNLAPGNHYVSIVSPGFHQVMKRVNPGPDPQLAIALEPAERADDLKSLSAAVAAAFHAPKLEAPLAQVATAFNADQVLVVALEAPPGKPARVYAERGTAQPPALLDDLDQALPAQSGDQAKVIDALVTDAVTRDHALKSLRIAPVTVVASSGGGGGLRYAGFAVLGAGVVAAGIGTVFGLGANSDVSNYRTTTQLNTTRSASLKSDGQSKALIANVTFGTALVAGVAGTLMAIFGGPHAAPAATDDSAKAAPSSPSSPASTPTASAPASSSPSSRSSKPAAAQPPPAAAPSSSASSSSASSSTSSSPTSKPAATPPATSSSSSSSSSSPPPASTGASTSSSTSPSPPPSTPTATPAPPTKPADPTKKAPPKDLGEDIKD